MQDARALPPSQSSARLPPPEPPKTQHPALGGHAEEVGSNAPEGTRGSSSPPGFGRAAPTCQLAEPAHLGRCQTAAAHRGLATTSLWHRARLPAQSRANLCRAARSTLPSGWGGTEPLDNAPPPQPPAHHDVPSAGGPRQQQGTAEGTSGSAICSAAAFPAGERSTSRQRVCRPPSSQDQSDS